MKQLKKMSMVMGLVLSVFCFAACSNKADTKDNTTENNDATENTDTTKNKDTTENKDTTKNKDQKDTTGNNATNNDATTDRNTTGTDNNSMDGTVNGAEGGEGYLERAGEDIVDGVEDFGDAVVGKDKNHKTGNTDADANSTGTQSNQ